MIAIIDDDASVRRALRRLFQSHGMPATVFDSAEEFLRTSRDVGFAVLVVDVALGGMSGLDLLESVAEEARSTPAVVITAQVTESVLNRAGRLGVPVLHKPFDETELLAYVEAVRRRA